MAPKRATFMSYGDDTSCAETRKFIEESGILLTIRDIREKPLNKEELSAMIGYLDINHFLDANSKAYAKFGFDKKLPSREEVIARMAEDYTLLRRPIIRSARLITIGCDKEKITQMLQLGMDPESSRDDTISRNNNGRSNSGRSSGGRLSNNRSSNRRREAASHK